LPEPLQQATIAMLAFSLAMRAAAAHPIGAAVTAAVGGILLLGTAMESLTAVFGKAQPATQAWQSTVQETTADLLRLARTGRTTGDLKSLTPMFFDLADGLKTANTELNFLERELSGMAGMWEDAFGALGLGPEFGGVFVAIGSSIKTTGDVLDEFRDQL